MQVPASARLHLRTAHSILTSGRVQRWAGLITSFLAGQGTVQLINLITGFFLLRWMSIESYAQFSIAFGFQSTLQWMVELGAMHSIIALTGDRGKDKETVGRYIRSAIYFRKRMFLAIVPLAAIAFPLIVAKHHWDWRIQLLLFISIAGALFFQGFASYYSAPFLINQRIKQYYKPQIFTSIARLIVCVLLHFASLLTSWASAWTNSAVIAVNSWLYRRKASDLVSVPKQADPEYNREMLNYMLPALPWLIFSAFQGQISLLLITIFGQTRNIAEIAALGRLGQLFLILGAFNSIVIAPYIAKVDRTQLARRYFQILGAAFIIAIFLTAVSFIFPEPLLWILGDKYQNLRSEIGWAIAVSCVGYIGTVMITMHSARKWIYWWWGSLNIIVSIIIQVVCIFLFDLSSTLNVLYFSLVTSMSTFAMLIVGGVYGFAYGPPKRLLRSFTSQVES
jgi:O-antigen/teichoic acid export membrane protein